MIKLRNPQQQYCSDQVCQNVRKNQWRRAKRMTDLDYKSNQCKANQCWRAKHKNYWKDYRKSHPDYVSDNRNKQQLRDRVNAKRKGIKDNASPLANSDALSGKVHIKPGIYRLVSLGDDLLANSDAYTVKIDLMTMSYPTRTDLAKRPPYSQSD
jgi:hypothetical protein